MARRIQANPRDRIESSSQWRSSPRPVDWPARVAAVKKRDVSCRWVEQGIPCGSTDRPEVDHIGDPKDHSLGNLRLLCHAHHKARTRGQAAEGVRRWQANRPKKIRPAEAHPGLTS